MDADTAADVHHRISARFLDKRCPFRSHVEAFVHGSDLACDLEIDVMALRLTPTAGRAIEAEHMPLNKVARHKRTVRGSAFSCATRCPSLLARLHADPSYIHVLSGEFAKSKDPKHLARALGLSRHPRLMELMSLHSKNNNNHLWSMLEKVVYR